MFDPDKDSSEHESILEFEQRIKNFKHKFCTVCKRVSLNLETVLNSKGKQVCTTCFNAKKEELLPEDIYLPLWRDEDGNPQYELPDELKDLRPAECLLIQQVKALVPLFHIMRGQLGTRGNVCAFMQKISEVCTIFPRLPSDTNLIRVVRHYKKRDLVQNKCKLSLLEEKR